MALNAAWKPVPWSKRRFSMDAMFSMGKFSGLGKLMYRLAEKMRHTRFIRMPTSSDFLTNCFYIDLFIENEIFVKEATKAVVMGWHCYTEKR
jgi:hypothetical protein